MQFFSIDIYDHLIKEYYNQIDQAATVIDK